MDKVYSPYLVLINKECCNQTVQRFFECPIDDANPEYKSKINDKIDDLLSNELINDFEASNLKQLSRTPHFYGLPKTHKEYTPLYIYTLSSK